MSHHASVTFRLAAITFCGCRSCRCYCCAVVAGLSIVFFGRGCSARCCRGHGVVTRSSNGFSLTRPRPYSLNCSSRPVASLRASLQVASRDLCVPARACIVSMGAPQDGGEQRNSEPCDFGINDTSSTADEETRAVEHGTFMSWRAGALLVGRDVDRKRRVAERSECLCRSKWMGSGGGPNETRGDKQKQKTYRTSIGKFGGRRASTLA